MITPGTKAVEIVRQHYREIEEFHEIFVVDDRHELKGKVSPMQLLLADPHHTVEEIMDDDGEVFSVETGETIDGHYRMALEADGKTAPPSLRG